MGAEATATIGAETGDDGEDLGGMLRALRTARRLSMGRLAERAGLSKGTLSNWEAGRFQPRLPELDAMLSALDATEGERALILARLNAPRAVNALRDQSEAKAANLVDVAGHAPAIGDLLGALRRRRGLSREQVAEAMRVHLSTVWRWERSETFVPPERREELWRRLGATPQERTALAEGRLWRGGEGEPEPLEVLEERCHALQIGAHKSGTSLADLGYLTLEAKLWPKAARSTGARRLLSTVYACHADTLEISRRGGEVRGYAGRALELMGDEAVGTHQLAMAVHALALASSHEVGAGADRRRLETLRLWINRSDSVYYRAVIYRDMAQYAAGAGLHSAAAEWVARAAAHAERIDASHVYSARHIRVHTLLEAGRADAALTLLAQNEGGGEMFARYLDAMQRVRVLLALGETTEAHHVLSRVYAFCRKLDLLTDSADELARRF